MRHRLRKHAKVAVELVRLTRDDLGGALAELEAQGPIDKRVHAIRQRLKWLRSRLRVLQGALGEDAATARHLAASTARLLATARDTDVAAASARALSAAAADDAGFDRLADVLDTEAATAHGHHAPLGEVKRRLETMARSAARFATDFNGEALLQKSILRAYRGGRQAMALAAESRATADLHRWRKHAKHLWHLLRMARSLTSRGTSKVADGFDQLAELLGIDHDHAMLVERLAGAPDAVSLARQLSLIAERRRGIVDQALASGARLYADKPADFARRHGLKVR
jgi:hypothetical protein